MKETLYIYDLVVRKNRVYCVISVVSWKRWEKYFYIRFIPKS